MYKFLSLLVLLEIILPCSGNNLAVSNVSLANRNSVLSYVNIKFDLSVENSWRVNSGSSNWDAAWIIAKYRVKNQTNWQHATFNYVDGTGLGDGHIAPAGAEISSSNDTGVGGAKGVLIYGSSNFAQSNVVYNGNELRWNYGVDGLTSVDSVEVCLVAVEMVYT